MKNRYYSVYSRLPNGNLRAVARELSNLKAAKKAVLSLDKSEQWTISLFEGADCTVISWDEAKFNHEQKDWSQYDSLRRSKILYRRYRKQGVK